MPEPGEPLPTVFASFCTNSSINVVINAHPCFVYSNVDGEPITERRITAYGLDRGFRFDERNRFLRTVGSFAPIRDKFDLAVGFGTTTVNRHSVELLVLDAKCAQVREFRRVQWDEAEVVVAVKEALAPLGAATP